MDSKNRKTEQTQESCQGLILPIRDALDVISGKWKLPIIASLYPGKKRFKQMSKELNGITDKTLSKELKDLEINQLIKRTVTDAYPPIVEYSITPHGRSLAKVLIELRVWGSKHRKKIMGK